MNSRLYLCRKMPNNEKCTCCLLLFKMHVRWGELTFIFQIWHHASNGYLVFFKSCFLVIGDFMCTF